MVLESSADDLLYELACCVEQNNRSEGFWHVVGFLVWLGDDN